MGRGWKTFEKHRREMENFPEEIIDLKGTTRKDSEGTEAHSLDNGA